MNKQNNCETCKHCGKWEQYMMKDQVRLCGNSVVPQCAEALVNANVFKGACV